jgi:hypothetical protein
VYDLLWGLVRFAIASLMTGVVLGFFRVGPNDLLAMLGLTPESALALLQRGFAWALPNMMLGSMVLVPIWLVAYMFRPPKA